MSASDPSPRRTARWILWVMVLLFLGLAGLFSHFYVVEIVWHFLTGWCIHLGKAGWRALQENAANLLLPLSCLAAAVWMGHRFVRWLLSHRGASWSGRQTLCVFALILLGSAAAIALSGVVHQVVWLSGSKWIESNKKAGAWMQTMEMRNLVSYLLEFRSEKGRYPESLEELCVKYPEVSRNGLMLQPIGKDFDPIVYRVPSGEDDAKPILIGSPIHGRIAVGFVNGDTNVIPMDQFEVMMFGTQPQRNP